eukprot:TRINITY_DN4725_c3_g1_i1.p1 TRINITY_DN4725_c3_g1~~TRINITY_DN4725_c3_g1_i1.p1  ORF type:complete len:366 (+),score=95.30 TRINITY_DN4725_c3_g1_i1:121-1098(+)
MTIQEHLLAPLSLMAARDWPQELSSLWADPCVWYHRTPPLESSFLLMLGVSLFCWLASLLTGNCSYVDRVWSITPAVYVAHFYASTNFTSTRLLLMTALITLWGARLSYNFYRKGGYNLSDEDYRWPIIRAKLHPLLFQLFNISFIALYQNFLLWCISLPAYAAYLAERSTAAAAPLNSLDYAAAAAVLFFLLLETVADQQQWVFQNEKYRLINAQLPRVGDYARGFLTHGLFRFSRHPNFFGEQSLWVSFNLFALAASQGDIYQCWWYLLGAAQLLALFQGSTSFTEDITKAKYPEYAHYQQCTSRLIPFWPFGAMPPVHAKIA